MAGMSALTVRANMRMVFDQDAANKAQAQYMARIAEMEQGASTQTANVNKALINGHRGLVRSLKAENDKADQELLNSKKAIGKKVDQISERQKRQQKLLKPRVQDYTSTKEFNRATKDYERAANKIRTINKKVTQDATDLGAKGLSTRGGKITTTQFLQQERNVREKIIKLQKDSVNKLREGSREQALAKIRLDKFVAAQKMANAEELKYGNIKMSNNAKIRNAEINTSKNIALNNRLLKERMAMLHRVNGAIDSAVRQLTGGFQNALMYSGIAVMSFGFKLQGVISDFMAFEKELINAQSIYQTTYDILFDLSDKIVQFGTKYGVSLQDASEGLYTLASAGLSAEDSMSVLTETLKLSMAVQGDHDTIAKLTTQTIFGFGKDASDASTIVDQFAHSINKSLIEYQDLASSVKFAMPFFVSTNQELEQLLGALEILSNRALEAGIAGRGLRQTLAEFAQHAEDNTAAFRKLGVEIVDNEGKFKDLTVIADEFRRMIGDTAANDVELMTTLLEDLNVRGATAFVHLVRESEEFGRRVEDLKKTTGAATDMADEQQKSLANQIQVIKNALMAPFLLSDQVGRTNETLNSFGDSLHKITEEFESLFLVTTEEGRKLSEFGVSLRETVLVVLEDLSDLVRDLLIMFTNMNTETNGLSTVIHALILPLRVIVKIMNLFGDGVLQAGLMIKFMNGLLPIAQLQTAALTLATMKNTQADAMYTQGVLQKNIQMIMLADQMKHNTLIQKQMMATQLGANLAMYAGLYYINKTSEAYQALGYIMLMVAGAFTAAGIARALFADSKYGTVGVVAAMAAGAAAFAGIGYMIKEAITPPSMNMPAFSATTADAPIADMGMRMYDMGGIAGRHFPVMVEPGETIIPKTQNMLSGGSGITLNIQGDVVTNDAEDFAERIAEALPQALRMQNDIGGI